MLRVTKLLLTLVILQVGVDSYLIPQISNFRKDLSFSDKRVLLSQMQNVITENESFLYAICDSTSVSFKENRCNVTVETPAFTNATYREKCILNFAPENKINDAVMDLRLQSPFGDDKALLTWNVVEDSYYHVKYAKVRILRMSTCNYLDIPVPAEQIHTLVVYDNVFDVIFRNKSFCGSDSCRITYDADGKKISGPVKFLSNARFSSVHNVIPASQHLRDKGYYVLALNDADSEFLRVFKVTPDGTGTELLKITRSFSNIKVSNSHDLFGVCWATKQGGIVITCRQYDARNILKLSTDLKFDDEIKEHSLGRWLQPHNLQEGGMLLVTGDESYESFSVIKIHPDGHRDRPLEIGGFDFACSNILQLYVNVSENDEDEFCFHFLCDRSDFTQQLGIRNTLKLNRKCLPKRYASIVKHRASLIN